MLPFEWRSCGVAPVGDRQASKDDLYGIFYTCGTTGRPKGIMLSNDSMMVNALIVNTGLGRYKPTSQLLPVAPLFHMAAFGHSMGVSLVGGSNIVLPGLEPDRAAAMLVTGDANASMHVPTMDYMFVATLSTYLGYP